MAKCFLFPASDPDGFLIDPSVFVVGRLRGGPKFTLRLVQVAVDPAIASLLRFRAREAGAGCAPTALMRVVALPGNPRPLPGTGSSTPHRPPFQGVNREAGVFDVGAFANTTVRQGQAT